MLTQNQIDNLILRFEALIGHLELRSRTMYEKELIEALDKILSSFVQSSDMTELAARREVAKVITEEFGDIYGNLGNTVIDDMALMAGITFDIYKYAYSNSSVEKALSFTKKTLIHGYELGDLLGSNEVDGVKQFKRIIAQGLAEGKNPIAVQRELKKQATRTLNHVSGVVIGDAMSEAMGQARKESYRILEKQGIVDGVEWVATFEANTCRICAAYDGRRWKTWEAMIKETGGETIHFRCRCTQVFDTDAKYLSETRAGKQYYEREEDVVKGKSFRDMDYSEWLSQQPESIQKAVKSGKYLSRKSIVKLLKTNL